MQEGSEVEWALPLPKLTRPSKHNHPENPPFCASQSEIFVLSFVTFNNTGKCSKIIYTRKKEIPYKA